MTLPVELKNLYSSNRINPIGSITPQFYLLTDPVSSYCSSPLSDERFQYIVETLSSTKIIKDDLDFLSSFRVSTSLQYSPQEPCPESAWKKRDRSATDEDIINLRSLILDEIDLISPKVIIACGSIAIKMITEFKLNSIEEAEEFSSTNSFKYKEIPVVFSTSIREIFKSTKSTFVKKELSKFSGKILQAKNLSNGVSLVKDTKLERLDIFNPEDIKRLNDLFLGKEKLVLDYETSGLNTYIDGFHLGGIGLCSLDCEVSVYIYFYDFFRKYTKTNSPPKECLDYLNTFFSTKKFVVFNKLYECAVTISPAIGININLKDCEDVLMWLRCLSESSSLKDAAVNRLGVSKWSDSVGDWVNCINEIMKCQKPTTSMKGQREEIEWMMSTDTCETLFDIEKFFISEFDNEIIKELKRVAKNQPKILKDLNLSVKDIEIINEFCTQNKVRLNSAKEREGILEEFKALELRSSAFTYNKGKENFLTKKDINFLENLNILSGVCQKYFKDQELKEIGKKLKYYIISLLENHSIFESASYADVPIQIIEPYCIADCNYTAKLYESVKFDLEEKGLVQAAEVYNKHAYLGYILARNGIAWDDELATNLKLEYENTKMEALRSLITLPEMTKVLELNASTLLNVRSTTDLEILKSVLNPMSSYKYTGENAHKTVSTRMSKVICTPRFKLASLLYDVYEFSAQVEDQSECSKEFPTLYPIYKKIISLECTKDRLEFLQGILDNIEERLSVPMAENRITYSQRYKKNPQEIHERLKYKGYVLEGCSQEHTENLYRIFETILAIDPNNDSSWPEEFKALFYFKIFKKTEKSTGTYLEGTVGRESVEIIKRSDAQNECPLRIAHYRDRDKIEDEIYINKTYFGVCSASTKRWQSSQHTVPKSTELMDLRTTRYLDGVKLHFDYCLHKDTTVVLGDGTTSSLLEMYDGSKNGINYTCISKNTKTNKLEEKKVLEVIRNSYRESLLEIELEDGLIVKCTPEHKFYLKNGEIKEAKDLTTEDELDNFSNIIKCEFCFKDFKELQWQHLNSHNIKISEYRESNKLSSEYTSYIRGRYRKDNPLSEYHLFKLKEGQRIKGPISPEERNRRVLFGKKRYLNPIEIKPEFKKQEFINSYRYLPTLELCKNKGYLFKIVTEKEIL